MVSIHHYLMFIDIVLGAGGGGKHEHKAGFKTRSLRTSHTESDVVSGLDAILPLSP